MQKGQSSGTATVTVPETVQVGSSDSRRDGIRHLALPLLRIWSRLLARMCQLQLLLVAGDGWPAVRVSIGNGTVLKQQGVA